MRIRRLFPCLLLLLLVKLLVSQPSYPGRFHRFERLTFRAEAPVSVGISSVCQDSQGFLWLGTSAGLARFDGYRLVFFYPQDSQQPAPEQIGVYPVTLSASGDIWFGTSGQGLFRLSPETGQMINYRHDADLPGTLSDDNVMAVQEDLQGDLWVGTRSGGLNRFDQATGTFARVLLGPGTDVVWDVLAERHGTIWVGTLEAGLFRIDPASGDSRNYRFQPDDFASLGSDTVWTVFEDEAGSIWVGTKNGGLCRYVPETDAFARFYGGDDSPHDLASQTITAVTEDDSGRLWLGTASDGLRIWDPRTSEYLFRRHDPQDRETLGDNSVTSLFRDITGIIWVGTVGSGLNKCLADRVKFAHFKHEASDPRSLVHSDVRALWADGDGTLWVGTKSGLDRWDTATGRVTRALQGARMDPEDPTGRVVTSLVRDGRGVIWLGTESAGLIEFDPRTGLAVRHRRDPKAPDSLSHNRINALWLDRERPDLLWVGTQRGLNGLETRTRKWTSFRYDPQNADGLSSNIITAIDEAGPGFLWVGTTSGLNRLDKATGRCEAFVRRFEDPPGTNISNNTVNCLRAGRDGRLWVGTDGGLNRFDRAAGRWEIYAEKDGLAGAVVRGILEDSAGSLWVSTNRGLSRLDPEPEKFTSFGLRDGLQGLGFNRAACAGGADGTMYFGGANGFNAFNPADLRKDPFVPPVVWTAFYRNNEEVKLPGTVLVRRDLPLTYKSGLVTLEFAALDFAAAELNSFAYRLEPRDNEWISIVPDHRVSLYDLEPGRYTLRVKASNPDGVWNEEGIAVEITLLPPFWKTWWFRLIAAAGLLFGAALAFRVWRKIKDSPSGLGGDLDGIIGSYDLTAREREILRFVLQGASNKDIEGKLFISASTVRNHIYNIYQKLGVRNRLELINRVGRDARKAP